jgi:hypothetical protein
MFVSILRALHVSLEHSQTRQAAAYTIGEFCDSHRVSRAKLYDLWAQKTADEPFGKGPRYFLVGNHRRITNEAAADWRRAGEAEAAAEHGRVAATESGGRCGEASSQLRREHGLRTAGQAVGNPQFEKEKGHVV